MSDARTRMVDLALAHMNPNDNETPIRRDDLDIRVLAHIPLSDSGHEMIVMDLNIVGEGECGLVVAHVEDGEIVTCTFEFDTNISVIYPV